ncbi:MAG: Fe-S cluster assembly protein SufD [Alphaproteobacteria bacterium]|nr:MAG: Fe-S cluster assembly protein SufD [Alphaproteobacteria bacterium]
MSNTQLSYSESQLASHLNTQPKVVDSEWLAELKEKGRDNFLTRGFPDRRQENWKYTDIRTKFRDNSFDAPYDNGSREKSRIVDEDILRVVVQDGKLTSIPSELPKGIAIRTLEDVLQNDEFFLRRYLGENRALPKDGMISLNSALLQKGLVVTVEPGGIIDQTIYIERFSNVPWNSIESGRDIIQLGERSSVKIVEVFVSSVSQFSLTHNVSEVYVEKGATLEHAKFQLEGNTVNHITTIAAEVSEGATFKNFEISNGGDTVRNETYVNLLGEGAHASLSGVFLKAGKEHCDTTTVVNHIAPDCTCNEEFRGILAERARGVFQGKIGVAKNAQKSDGRMMTRALLLSDRAEMDAKPELEIYADDVKCAHGATIGSLDNEALFYLRSRGIPEVQAKTLLMRAFVSEAIQDFGDEIIRESANQLIEQKLEFLSRGGYEQF